MKGSLTGDADQIETQLKGATTKQVILSVLTVIEGELQLHGYYPHNRGKLTILEIARRAGVGSSTLRNKHHHDIRAHVKKWLKTLRRDAPVTTAKAKTATQNKIDWYENALRKVNAEAVKWRFQLVEMQKTQADVLAKLQQENQNLKKQLRSIETSDTLNVIGINSKSTHDDRN